MFSWTDKNSACKNTWTTLLALKQFDCLFADAGGKKMTDLAFWNKAASDEIRGINAQSLAIQMDNVLTKIRLAKYESGKNGGTAVSGIANILVGPNKTVTDLAAVIDENYLFRQENKTTKS